MAIFTTRHDENVNFSIRLVIDFKPISEEDAERMLPLLKRANGKYGFTELKKTKECTTLLC